MHHGVEEIPDPTLTPNYLQAVIWSSLYKCFYKIVTFVSIEMHETRIIIYFYSLYYLIYACSSLYI